MKDSGDPMKNIKEFFPRVIDYLERTGSWRSFAEISMGLVQSMLYLILFRNLQSIFWVIDHLLPGPGFYDTPRWAFFASLIDFLGWIGASIIFLFVSLRPLFAQARRRGKRRQKGRR